VPSRDVEENRAWPRFWIFWLCIPNWLDCHTQRNRKLQQLRILWWAHYTYSLKQGIETASGSYRVIRVGLNIDMEAEKWTGKTDKDGNPGKTGSISARILTAI
jgi:hypothetical protein